MSNIDNAFIDRIVAEVVARLNEASLQQATQGSEKATATPTTATNGRHLPSATQIQQAVSHDGKSVTLGDKLISRATVKSLDKKITTVHILPDAVVTPAVKDELQDRGIAVIRGKKGMSPVRLPMIWVAVDGVAGTLAGKIQGEVHEVNELTTAVSKLSDYVNAPGKRAVIITDRPAVAAASLNRVAHARAAWIGNLEQLHAAQSTLAPNAMLIDDQIATSHLGINLLNQFFHTGKELPCGECQAVLDTTKN